MIIPSQTSQKEKREDSDKIRNERGEITTNTKEIQTISREYYDQLNANQLGYLEDIDKFIETYELLKTETRRNRIFEETVSSKETESVFKNLPTNKSSGPDDFPGELYQNLKEELIPIILKPLKKNRNGS